MPTQWEMYLHDDFQPEFDALVPAVQDALLALARAVEIAGPMAGRPHVGTRANPKHPNMKELRFTALNGTRVWRAAFAFDPQQKGLILVAADKQGKEEMKFYKALVAKANRRFDAHLAALAKAKKARK